MYNSIESEMVQNNLLAEGIQYTDVEEFEYRYENI